MKAVDIILLVLIGFVIILIAVVAWRIHATIQEKNLCENSQSRFCYMITCPCDSTTAGPCLGYAYRDSGDNNFYCTSDPTAKVDSTGKLV